ncbi:MAG: hypothetical protein ABI693_32620 [Bryobacteraceae bacterium]
MSTPILREVRAALSALNPADVRKAADRPVRIGLLASYGEAFAVMEDFLAPPELPQEKRIASLESVYRIGEDAGADDVDFILAEEGMRVDEPNTYVFNTRHPRYTVLDVIDGHEDLQLPLARRFPAFRSEVSHEIVGKIARENAMCALATALPSAIAGWVSLPWAIGEFASDTTVLTGNQIRMAFLLAAASDREPGYAEQRTEVAMLIAGAFGFRSLARTLASKIPLGAGLLPKAAIAYAGTWVAGKSFEQLYRFGSHLSPDDRRDALAEAYDRGKFIVSAMLDAWRSYPAGHALTA